MRTLSTCCRSRRHSAFRLNAIRAQGDESALTALGICRAFAGGTRACWRGPCLPPGCWGGR